jgi:trimethylamine--corrinoid protein Co-methyltransferase
MKVQLLDAGQIKAIHEASLKILERVGVMVPHAETLRRFADAGAGVDFEQSKVRIGPELVMRLLAQATKSFTLYGRDPAKTAAFGRGRRNYNSSAGQALWIDEPGGVRRFPSLDDVVTAGRLGDALPRINIVGAMADPHELPVQGRAAEVLATLVRQTTKPVHVWLHNRASAHSIVEIIQALRGDSRRAAEQPLCYAFLEPISPLRFPFDGVDLLYEVARIDMPVSVGPMAQMGLSAPATLSGTMAVENAEILAGICIAQLVRPGTAMCYGGVCHAFDMATTQIVFGGPEQALFGVAMTELGRSYGLPVYVNVGLTDAKRPDAQAGLESGVTLAMAAAAGADIFGHMGICGADQGASLDTLMLQHEIIDYVEGVMRPVAADPESIALDVIESVGAGGSFLACDHTVDHFRRELWFPSLLDRRFYDAWRADGAAALEARCTAQRRELLAAHQAAPLDPALDKALNSIVASDRQPQVAPSPARHGRPAPTAPSSRACALPPNLQ